MRSLYKHVHTHTSGITIRSGHCWTWCWVLSCSVCPTLLRLYGLYVICQVPLSMGFTRKEHWRGLPFPTPGDLPDPAIEPAAPALAGRFFYHGATREAHAGHGDEAFPTWVQERCLQARWGHGGLQVSFPRSRVVAVLRAESMSGRGLFQCKGGVPGRRH